MTLDAITQNLKDAGCSATVIKGFLRQRTGHNAFEQKRILDAQRDLLLKKIHASQKRLDCLDYLIYQLEKLHR